MAEDNELMVASYQIASLSQSALELVFNSIDAKSKSIAVRLDPTRHSLEVVDNGCGISSSLFPDVGKTPIEPIANGKRKKFGRRGAALKHICVLSKWMQISTRTEYGKPVEKTFANGEELELKGSDRPHRGTTVAVGVLFHRLPVRIKSVDVQKELERICDGLNSLRLLFPLISFSLRDDSTEKIVTQLHRLKQEEPDVAETFRQQFGHLYPQHLERIECRGTNDAEFKFVAYVGQSGIAGKHLQFVFVNFRPVFRSVLHTLINSPFKVSAICKKSTLRNYRGKRSADQSVPGLNPVFVAHLRCHPSMMEFCHSGDQTLIRSPIWSTLEAKIKGAINTWLIQKKLVASPPPIIVAKVSSVAKPTSKTEMLNEDPDELDLPECLRGCEGVPVFGPPTREMSEIVQFPWVCKEESVEEKIVIPAVLPTVLPTYGAAKPAGNIIGDGVQRESMFSAKAFRPRPAAERPWRIKPRSTRMPFELKVDGELQIMFKAIVNQRIPLVAEDFVFTKEMLKRPVVIGQFDSKFVCCTFAVPKGLILALVDQHAADERIQLEKLRRHYCLDTDMFSSQRLPVTISVELLDSDILVLSNNQSRLKPFGLQLAKKSARVVAVTHVPVALLGEEWSGGSVDFGSVLNLLSDVVEILKDGCVGQPVPETLRDRVAMEACRKAIKFGDSLSEEDCQQLLLGLSECQLPFQCAHGRPTIIPVKFIL